MTRVNKKCFQLNLGWKRTSRKHFSASAFISRSRPSASTSKMALASKTFSLMSFFNLGFNWKNFSFTLVPFFLTVFYNNFDNKILILCIGMFDFFMSTAPWDYQLWRYFSTTKSKINRLNTHSLIYSTGQDKGDFFHGFMNYVIT